MGKRKGSCGRKARRIAKRKFLEKQRAELKADGCFESGNESSKTDHPHVPLAPEVADEHLHQPAVVKQTTPSSVLAAQKCSASVTASSLATASSVASAVSQATVDSCSSDIPLARLAPKRANTDARPNRRPAKRSLMPDFTAFEHRRVSSNFLESSAIRTKSGRRKLLYTKHSKKSLAKKQSYDQRRAKVLLEKSKRYKRSPNFKKKVLEAAKRRYDALAKTNTKDDFFVQKQREMQRDKQRQRYHKSPGTREKWLASAKKRQSSPTKRPLINQAKRKSRVSSPETLARNLKAERLRQQCNRAKKRKQAKTLMQKYRELRLRRIQYGRERIKIGEANFARWATVRIHKSYAGQALSSDAIRYIKKKHRIARYVDGALILRRKMLNDMSKALDSLREFWVEAQMKLTRSLTPDAELADFYGGQRYHLRSAERYGIDKVGQKYVNVEDVLNQNEENEVSKEVTEDQGPTPGQEPTPVSFNNSSERPNFVAARPCDQNCVLPSGWASRLHRSLEKLTDAGNPLERLKKVMDFESCTICYNSVLPIAPGSHIDCCGDNFRVVNQVIAPHFKGARALRQRLYRIRKMAMWVLNLEAVACQGNYSCFIDFIRNQTQLMARDNTSKPVDLSRETHVEARVEKEFGHLLREWNEAVSDYPVNPCSFCKRLFEKKNLATIEDEKAKRLHSDKFHVRVQEYIKSGRLKFPCQLCNRCIMDLNMEIVPRYSVLNEMGVDEVPPELQNLNYISRLLLQLQKSFMTVFRLKPYRYRGPTANLTKAMRGSVIHLPLPKDTMTTTLSELPDTSNISILVDSLPTNQRMVWRSLIDVDEWKKAFELLKKINPLYENVSMNPILLETEACAEDIAQDDQSIQAQKLGPPTSLSLEPDTLLRRVQSDESYEQFTVQCVQQKLPNASDIDLYAVKRVTAEPVPDDDPHKDVKSYPFLFPTGKYGLQAVRVGDGRTKIGRSDYFKARILHEDPRFRRDLQWVFDSHHQKQMANVDSGIYATMNLQKGGRKYTAAQMQKMCKNRADQIERNLYTMMSKVRGTKEAWNSVKTDCDTMDAAHGPCTFFMTLSCSEYDLDDFREFLLKRNPDIPDISFISTSTLCALDPVSVAEHFQRKFELFMEEVLLQDDGPLGKISHYAWRIEYQARGMPHVHMKLWVEGAPIHGRDSNEVIRQFIDKYVTCQLPDQGKDPVLHNLVLRKQLHKCGSNCYRKAFAKFRGPNSNSCQQFLTRCRAGFPRQVTTETTVLKLEESLKSRSSGKRVKKLYDLRRSAREQYINDYNPAILLAWKANMDIQYVGEKSGILNHYITSYQFKFENANTESLWNAVDKSKTVRGQLKSFACKSFRSREVSAPEAAANVLGLRDHCLSDKILWLGVNKPEDRRRCLKKFKDIEEMADDDTEIFFDNWIDVYYAQRPDSLEEKSLHDMASEFDVKKYNPHCDDRNKWSGKPQFKNGKGYFNERRKPCLIKFPNINPEVSADSREKYFHNLLMLFKPWREESELLCGCATYEEAFLTLENDACFEKMVKVHRAKEALNEALKYAKEVEKKGIEEDQQVTEAMEADDALDAGFEENEPCQAARMRDENELEAMVGGLNEDQKTVFDQITNVIDHRETHEQQRNSCTCPGYHRLSFVSGVGGTGKSHLIHTLVASVEQKYGPQSVAVSAPTGLAALNIGGVTIHKLLKLPVQHGKDPEYWNLSKPDLKAMRRQFKNVRLFILDEVSMASNALLAYCHCRLHELFGDDNICLPFGGAVFLVFGDLLQLPPVNAQFCFDPLGRSAIRKVFGGVSVGSNLWDEFNYYELQENMRQKDDLAYAELLGRARIGCLTEKDIEDLAGRVVCVNDKGEFATADQIKPEDREKCRLMNVEETAVYLDRLHQNDEDVLTLLPKNESVDKVNRAMLLKAGNDIHVIVAQDYTGGKRGGKSKPLKSGRKKRVKTSETAGLEDELVVSKGCRLMIRRNIDAKRRLMNGSLARLLDLEFKPLSSTRMEVESLILAVDGVDQPVTIKRVQGQFMVGRNVVHTRHQFPVITAYSVTTHKSQALSLNTLVADLGPECFESGMAYVALSRCRRLANVHLTNFDKDVVRCKPECVKEYNRLRRKFTAIPPFSQYNKSVDPTRKRKSVYSLESLLTDDISTKELRDASVIPRKSFKPGGSHSLHHTTIFTQILNSNATSCYANCIVQALLQLDETFWDRLELFGAADLVCKELIALRNTALNTTTRSILNTDNLRILCGPPFDILGEQNDASCFLVKLFEHFPADVESRFKHEKATGRLCSSCDTWASVGFDETDFVWQSAPRGSMDLLTVIETPTRVENIFCVECGRRTVQTAHSFPNFASDGVGVQYFWVQFSPFEYVDGIPKRFGYHVTGMRASGVRLGKHKLFGGSPGRQLKPLCFIEHSGETLNAGHYTAWVRQDSGWIHISDTSVTKTAKTVPPGLSNVVLLLLSSTA